MWYDADIDRIMSRTAMRPIPRNLVPAEEALALGLFLSGASVVCLGVMVNWLASGLLALTIAYYVLIYTMWLKRTTAQNIVIGGAAGAFPPMIGWAAASGDVTLNSILLFAIIFFWTPAHFWALALLRFRDYERAGVPMLPNVAGKRATKIQIVVYSILTGVSAVAPYFTGLGGVLYLTVAALTSAILIYLSVDVLLKREGHGADKAAKRLFSYSILYLFVVFAAILAEHAMGLA
jgi:protoheme IX farnesyltransferase